MEDYKVEFVDKDKPKETVTVIKEKPNTESSEFILIFFGVLCGGLAFLYGNFIQGIAVAGVLVGVAMYFRKKRVNFGKN